MVSLRDLFRIEKGQIGIRAATPGKFPLVTTAESYLSHIEAHFSGDSVCIPMISATGHGHASIKRLHHIKGDFAVGSILCACINQRPERVSARYVFHYLTARKDSVLIPLMQGSANVSLKLADIEGINIPLPPLADQLAIVTRLDTLADKTRQVTEHLDAIEADAERLLAVRFREAIASAPYRPMAEVAPPVRRPVGIDTDKTYREVGARSFGKGLFTKPAFDGADATWQKPVWIESGDLVLSNIKAWEGAIAVAGTKHSGCIASHRYITCVPNRRLASADFLRYYFLTDEGMEKVGFASPGTADRNRTLSTTSLLKMEAPVPSLEVQHAFDTLQAKVTELKARHTVIREANAALVPAALERIFSVRTSNRDAQSVVIHSA
jgi:type I restriction enzyme S subunit